MFCTKLQGNLGAVWVQNVVRLNGFAQLQQRLRLKDHPRSSPTTLPDTIRILDFSGSTATTGRQERTSDGLGEKVQPLLLDSGMKDQHFCHALRWSIMER